MTEKTKMVRYNGKAFVRGWKPGEERELPESEADQFNNPRGKALGFKVSSKASAISPKSKAAFLSKEFGKNVTKEEKKEEIKK
jgi:hypothetical protein